ncbi:hypothetical protein [Synechococcus sp. PCC 6312]|uniref:hypothetical protein n=1 Tax=Synechococcus sp. (strain ATCC 27167 / PCC 6312) TaxID=195253 RepID=UPI00029F24DE|nr:hypothetical protein [Synechococcus sp. PCC 6312]AFY60081.1 hypothetical protein Syn6312_0873 [Synechococcus sp. PCC 6312]
MSALSQLIQLRRQQEQLATQIKALEPQAIDEAMTAISETERKTFDVDGVKVQLRFKTLPAKPKDDPELEFLDLEIKRLHDAQVQKYQADIEAKQAAIKALQTELEALTNTEQIQRLQQEFNELAEAKAIQQTILALSF